MERRKTRIRKDGRILELPSHLILEILSRLTIETIFSCKCVCKKLLEILTDPYFVELHLTKAPNNEDGLIIQDRLNIFNFLLVYDNRLDLGKPGSDKANCDSRPCQTMAMPTNASQVYNYRAYVIGSCNGLLCIRYSALGTSRIYYICNPILGEFFALPAHVQSQNFRSENVGFGFCPKIKQYKVLRFVTPSSCSIYTLGTDSWRQIGEAPYPRTVHSFDSSLNGNLHWITNSTKMSNLICSFNLETEQFSYISSPTYFNHVVLGCLYVTIGLLDGLFCFNYYLRDKYEVFVMKDYGPEGLWTKKLSVDFNPLNSYLQGRPQNYGWISFLNNGELVLRCDITTLIGWDLRKGTTRHIIVGENYLDYAVLSFVPSFISLKNMPGADTRNVEVVQRKAQRNVETENGFNFIR